MNERSERTCKKVIHLNYLVHIGTIYLGLLILNPDIFLLLSVRHTSEKKNFFSIYLNNHFKQTSEVGRGGRGRALLTCSLHLCDLTEVLTRPLCKVPAATVV